MKKPSSGDVIAQHYRLGHVLGEGSTSLVFAAENIITGKLVALKWLLPQRLREREVSLNLLREAMRNGSVVHPNVANVSDVGRYGGSMFLVTELLHGKPLSDFFPGALADASSFLKLMVPVLRGVQAAHDAGIVHGGLRPDKVLLCVDERGLGRKLKVLDFGVAKLTQASQAPRHEVSRADAVPTTPHYLAPEQLHDPRACDERSDVYALGVIVYRALSGMFPFDGETLSEQAILVCDNKAIPLDQRAPRVPRGLNNVVMRALEVEPKRRYHTVLDMASALEPYLERPEASLRALLNLTEHHEPRPESAEDAADRRSLRQLGALPTVKSMDPPPRRSATNGRMRPPPPPRSKPAIAESEAHSTDTIQSLPPFPTEDAPTAAGRRNDPVKTTRVLPPVPPPSAKRAPWRTSEESTAHHEPTHGLTNFVTPKTPTRDEDCTASHRIDRQEQTSDAVLVASGKQS